MELHQWRLDQTAMAQRLKALVVSMELEESTHLSEVGLEDLVEEDQELVEDLLGVQEEDLVEGLEEGLVEDLVEGLVEGSVEDLVEGLDQDSSHHHSNRSHSSNTPGLRAPFHKASNSRVNSFILDLDSRDLDHSHNVPELLQCTGSRRSVAMQPLNRSPYFATRHQTFSQP